MLHTKKKQLRDDYISLTVRPLGTLRSADAVVID